MIEIFLFVIEDAPIVITMPEVAPRHPILDLELVCRAWRDSTMEMTPSWATFSVRLDTLPSSPISVLERLLARSKAAPLTFDFDVLGRPDILWVADAPAILSALLRHSSRWKAANICLIPSMMPLLLNIVHNSNFPQLERLSLLPLPSTPANHDRPLLILQNALERLHSLHTISAFIPKEPQPWMFRLQALELTGLCDDFEAHSVLKLCPNVVFVSLSFDPYYYYHSPIPHNFTHPGPEDRATVELLKLERLIISWIPPHTQPASSVSLLSVVRLPDWITAPCLNSLEINSPIGPLPDMLVGAIRTMLLRSECELRVLRLNTMDIEESGVSLFQALHSLTHLHISFQLNSAICEAMSFKPEDGFSSSTDVLFPSLRYLDISFAHISIFDRFNQAAPAFRQHLDLFHARHTPPPNSGVQPLESVTIHHWIDTSHYTALDNSLRPLRDAGLRVDTVDLAAQLESAHDGRWEVFSHPEDGLMFDGQAIDHLLDLVNPEQSSPGDTAIEPNDDDLIAEILSDMLG